MQVNVLLHMFPFIPTLIKIPKENENRNSEVDSLVTPFIIVQLFPNKSPPTLPEVWLRSPLQRGELVCDITLI